MRSFAIPAFISLNRPQGTLDFGSKYNVAHSSKTTIEMDVTDAQSFFHAFPPTLQVFPHVLDPPPAAHMGEPNQVHSLTSSETTREMDVTDAQRKSPRHRLRLFFVESGNVLLSQVIFPA